MTTSTPQSHLTTANLLRRRMLVRRWQRYQNQCLILRSQLGFQQITPDRPRACNGCSNYHGQVYGQSYDRRTKLICGMHPYGWQKEGSCPDWQEADGDSTPNPPEA